MKQVSCSRVLVTNIVADDSGRGVITSSVYFASTAFVDANDFALRISTDPDGLFVGFFLEEFGRVTTVHVEQGTPQCAHQCSGHGTCSIAGSGVCDSVYNQFERKCVLDDHSMVAND